MNELWPKVAPLDILRKVENAGSLDITELSQFSVNVAVIQLVDKLRGQESI